MSGMPAAEPPGTRILARGARLVLEPPGIVFHGVVGTLGLLVLWVGTLPGTPILPLVWLANLLIAGAVVWTVKLTVHLLRRRHGIAAETARRFVLAPIGGLVVALLLVSGAAFQLRWAVSQPSFERAVAASGDPGTGPDTISGRIGLYRFIGSPHHIDGAVFFHHPLGGGLFDDAGIAYLPQGATPEVDASFESLRVEQIEGPWHRWWSSW